MDKLAYIVRTLSRTRRKDYENYVVNAVWQRLADPEIKPVTQQYVRRADGSYFLIDLYFPQLSMGVECDEGYHESREQRDRDARREMELIDAIRQISEVGYTPLHVRIADRTLEAVDVQIDDAVAAIRERAAELRASGQFQEWEPEERRPSAAALGMEVLHVSDDIGFHTIAETCNATMGCNYKGMQKAFFHPKGLVANNIDMLAWFPKLSIDGVNASTHTGWVNTISPDGERIYQYNAKSPTMIEHDRERPVRIVFAQMRDPVTGTWSYRFLGIFAYAGIDKNANGMRCEVFRRTSDEWRIIR